MIILRPRQKSPAKRLVLRVVLSKRQGRDCLGELISQVKGVGRIDGLALEHLFEQLERIGALQVHFVVQHTQEAALGEETEIAVANHRCQFSKGRFTMLAQLRITEQNEIVIQMFWQSLMLCREV